MVGTGIRHWSSATAVMRGACPSVVSYTGNHNSSSCKYALPVRSLMRSAGLVPRVTDGPPIDPLSRDQHRNQNSPNQSFPR